MAAWTSNMSSALPMSGNDSDGSCQNMSKAYPFEHLLVNLSFCLLGTFINTFFLVALSFGKQIRCARGILILTIFDLGLSAGGIGHLAFLIYIDDRSYDHGLDHPSLETYYNGTTNSTDTSNGTTHINSEVIEVWFYRVLRSGHTGRNFWLLFLTLCRCVAVVQPLRHRKMHLLSSRKQFVAVCISLLLGIFAGGSSTNSETHSVQAYVQFLLGTTFPIFCVFTCSLVIAVHLSRSSEAASRPHRNKEHVATKIVLSISVFFLLLESPTVVLGVMYFLFCGEQSYIHEIIKIMLKASISLIYLDSSINFFAFLAFSHVFRTKVINFCTCKEQQSPSQHSRYFCQRHSFNSNCTCSLSRQPSLLLLNHLTTASPQVTSGPLVRGSAALSRRRLLHQASFDSWPDSPATTHQPLMMHRMNRMSSFL